MVPQPLFSSVSPRHQNVFQSKDGDVPQILSAAWMKNFPSDQPIVDQLNSQEKTFLILFSEYIVTALDSPLSASDPNIVLSDILMTARHRLSLLSKEVSLSPNYVVIVALLQLLTNLYSSDNMKYTTMDGFLEVYPVFQDRSSSEKDKLFHTANWMHILFQITTAKKNKGMVMDILPKFVEGNGVQYVTGSGQTQPTKDRVTVYETEGNVKPIKRQHRKTKKELMESVHHGGERASKGAKAKAKKKATYVKRKGFPRGGRAAAAPVVRARVAGVRHSHSSSSQQSSTEDEDVDNMTHDMNEDGGGYETFSSQLQRSQQSNYLPLSFAMAPPIPVRRSQSSFSKAAAAIAGYSESLETNQASDNAADNDTSFSSGLDSPTYVCSPRECYLDVEANGTMRKVTSAQWGMSSSLSSSSLSCMSPRSQLQHQNPDYQLQMLREVSEDSDFSAEDRAQGVSNDGANLLPPFLMHQQSLTLSLPSSALSTSASTGLGSPNPQPRSLERCPTATLDEGEVDFELIEVLSRHASSSWLSRSTSASSLSGRDSAHTVKVNA